MPTVISCTLFDKGTFNVLASGYGRRLRETLFDVAIEGRPLNVPIVVRMPTSLLDVDVRRELSQEEWGGVTDYEPTDDEDDDIGIELPEEVEFDVQMIVPVPRLWRVDVLGGGWIEVMAHEWVYEDADLVFWLHCDEPIVPVPVLRFPTRLLEPGCDPVLVSNV